MSDFKYVEIPFDEFKVIENRYREIRTIFGGNDSGNTVVYRVFAENGSEIILKYEYFYDDEDGNYYVVYKSISNL